MGSLPEISREEMEQLVKKAEKELQERLAQLTPEERAQAAERAERMIEEDRLANEKLLADAARILGQHDGAGGSGPRFCPHCGAKAEGGTVCEYCGMPLEEK